MEKLKSTLPNMAASLLVVAAVSAALLAYVNQATAGPIAEQGKAALENGIKSVMGGGDIIVVSTDTIGKRKKYVAYKVEKGGKPFGVAIESSANGFGGKLKTLVGFSEDGEVTGYTILESNETPGLGTKAQEWFQKGGKGDIIGRKPSSDKPLRLKGKEDGGDIDAITASTVTSLAFLKTVNQAHTAYFGKETDAHTGASKKAKH